jgi:hypothetical protein
MAHVILLDGPLGRQYLEKPVHGLLQLCDVVRHTPVSKCSVSSDTLNFTRNRQTGRTDSCCVEMILAI